MNEPKISVIMPTYNASLTIERSILSVLNQSYSNFELIIVDDCSTDNTVDVVSSISDDRLKLISLEKNSGSPSTPRNVGLAECKGDYIAFLDADDIWYPRKLEVQIEFMLIGNIDFSCTGYDIENYGKVVSEYIPPPVVEYHDLLTNNSIGCLTAIVSKRLIKDHRFPNCGHEDFALWLKLSKGIKVYSIDEKLACYNRMEGSVSADKKKLFGFFWNIYRNEEGFSTVRSLWLSTQYFINVVWFKYR